MKLREVRVGAAIGEFIPKSVRSLLDEYCWNVTSFVSITEELSLVGQVLVEENGRFGQRGKVAFIRLLEDRVQNK